MMCEPYNLDESDLFDLVMTGWRYDLDIAIHGHGPYGHGTVAIELTPHR